MHMTGETLEKFVLGQLSATGHLLVRGHLEVCSTCREKAEALDSYFDYTCGGDDCCPPDDWIRAYARGALAHPAEEHVEVHIETCDCCSRSLTKFAM